MKAALVPLGYVTWEGNDRNGGNGYIALKTSQGVFSSLVFLVTMRYWKRILTKYSLYLSEN